MSPLVQAIAFGVPSVAYGWAAYEHTKGWNPAKIVWFSIPCLVGAVVCAAAAIGVIDV